MANYTISKIKLPNGDVCNIKDTTYTAGTGIAITDNTIRNTGVREITTSSDSNGALKVNTNGTETAVFVKGIENGYLNIHPENTPILIPFIHNDIAHLLERGGSATLKLNGEDKTANYDLSAIFDGSGYYLAFGRDVTSTLNTIVLEITCHIHFRYGSTIYIDFGSVSWRATNIRIDVKNNDTNNYTDDWEKKVDITNNASGHYACWIYHTAANPKNNGIEGSGSGFNQIRFTLSGFQGQFRIAQIGVYNYGSIGVRETYMSRGKDDPVFRSITPNTTNIYYLGSNDKKWKGIYATTFTGNLTGNVTGNLTGNVTGNLTGNASTATLLKPITSTTTASTSSWNIPEGSKQVWGERFSDNTLKYTPSGGSATTITDTGDWVMWLTPNATSNAATLNMRIDGTYYGSFNGNVTGNVSGSAGSVALSGVTGADDLKAIEALSGTSGFLKKTATNTWSLDTNTYLTASTGVTSIAGKTGAVTLADLGLSQALRFRGKTTTTMSDGFTGTPAISGVTYTPTIGDVVIDSSSDSEYVCVSVSGTTYTWERLGSDSSWALDNAVIHNELMLKKGDMIYASKDKTPDRLAIGTAGYFLKATADGPRWANTTDITKLGTITAGTWNATTIGEAYGGTGETSLKNSANALINALDTGSAPLAANDYVITQYAGGGTTTTTYHRRPANKVIHATLVKAALGTDTTTTNQWLNKKGEWSTPTAANLGLGTMATETATNYLKWQSTSKKSTELYDFGVYVNKNSAAQSGPTNNNYFTLINIPYLKTSGNDKFYWGWQIGGDTNNNSRLWFRTTGDAVYGEWQEIAHAPYSTNNIGSATQPVYMTATGVITAGTTYAGGTAVTLNNSSKAGSTASFYAPTAGGTANTQALVGNGATSAPKWVNISPSISITAGTSSAAPSINVTVLGQSGAQAQAITIASTSVYGVTKLQDGISSTSTALAATANAAYTASRNSLHTLATTTKYYVTGTTSTTTSTGGDSFDTGVYVTATAGELSAVKHSFNVGGTEKARMQYDNDIESIVFSFV